MYLHNDSQRYASVLIALHWLMLILIVAVYACIELRVLFPKDSDPREALKTWHFMLGFLVLVLASMRIIVRLMAGPAPPIEPPMKHWQHMFAKAVHLIIYALMLGLPLTGWLVLSAGGKPIPFFGLELPPLTGEDKAFSKQVKEIHELAGKAGYFLIGIHAAAALFHHFIVHDNTVLRILARGR